MVMYRPRESGSAGLMVATSNAACANNRHATSANSTLLHGRQFIAAPILLRHHGVRPIRYAIAPTRNFQLDRFIQTSQIAMFRAAVKATGGYLQTCSRLLY